MARWDVFTRKLGPLDSVKKTIYLLWGAYKQPPYVNAGWLSVHLPTRVGKDRAYLVTTSKIIRGWGQVWVEGARAQGLTMAEERAQRP